MNDGRNVRPLFLSALSRTVVLSYVSTLMRPMQRISEVLSTYLNGSRLETIVSRHAANRLRRHCVNTRDTVELVACAYRRDRSHVLPRKSRQKFAAITAADSPPTASRTFRRNILKIVNRSRGNLFRESFIRSDVSFNLETNNLLRAKVFYTICIYCYISVYIAIYLSSVLYKTVRNISILRRLVLAAVQFSM